MTWSAKDIMLIFGFTLLLTVLCAAGMGFLPALRRRRKTKGTPVPVQPEKPDVTTITPPYKPSPRESLRAVNARRAATARMRAENAAWDLDAGLNRKETAKANGYASVDSMRKALSHWGFKMPPEKKGSAI